MPVSNIGGLASEMLGNAVKISVAKAVEKVAAAKGVPEIKKADAAPVTNAVINELAKDETFINATNSEPWWQSRVKVGVILAATGYIASGFGWEFDVAGVNAKVGVVMEAAGILYAGYGRFVPGLKPMWTRLLGWLGKGE